jgi:hypothetical protein
MSTIAKSAALGLCLVIGAAGAAYAQSENIAALPPDAAAKAPAAPVGPTGTADVVRPTGVSPQYVGPDPGRGFYPAEKQTRAITPSPAYIGPSPNSDQGGDN